MIRKVTSFLVGGLMVFHLEAQEADVFVNRLMSRMTLEEKIGQLNQYNGDWGATGKITADGEKEQQIKAGGVGSMLNVIGVEKTRKLQELALQSRLHIPLLFGQDVIHGFRTTMPVPLGETATWDLSLIEQSARIAATEAAAYGIHWTFAPMVDIGRDPRWGRVMEGAGEDTYLGCRVAEARVKGFQGKGLGHTDAVMACVKHFAAYGAAVGGRDYNSVDMSLRQLNEVYLPPFKSAVMAGAATLMNSFNDINGIPATANTYILREKLKKEWNFGGFVVSDWGSIGEMVAHGYAQDGKDAAAKAMVGGCDMDMESRCYIRNLKTLVDEGKINVELINDAVKRILIKKYELGLFDDPFRFCNPTREQSQKNNQENRHAARLIGSRSIVLLKNQGGLLPLSNRVSTLALIGPFAKATTANHGFWAVSFDDDSSRIVSQYEGIRSQLDSKCKLLYAKGCNENDDDKSGFARAVAVARQAEVVVLSLGEGPWMSGEAKSRSNLHFSGVQEELLQAIAQTGKPIVLLVNAGRPLIFDQAAGQVQSILYTWWLGTEAGNSIADVLFGKYNPSGKLPMTFPRSEGQIPIYYNHFNTGRPARDANDKIYVSAYIDQKNDPQYPFGYGLSYTRFELSDLKLSSEVLSDTASPIRVQVDLKNAGDCAGEEVVQLYIHDKTGCVVRPVRELKGFEKVLLKAGESRRLEFSIRAEDLKFYNDRCEYINEPGQYEVFVGNSSVGGLKAEFELTPPIKDKKQ